MDQKDANSLKQIQIFDEFVDTKFPTGLLKQGSYISVG